MVSALTRKLLRDVRRQSGQVISIALLVGCGVMAVIGMRSTHDSLQSALDDYYARYRFGDVFATLTRAPEPMTSRIRNIDGVAAVQTRVTAQATLSVPGLDGAATGQLVSVPSTRQPTLNDLHLFRGRWVAADRDDEVIVSVRFAEANHLAPGDTLAAVVNGRWQSLRVVGIASSPDFAYEIATSGFLVDNRRYGILWMRREALAAATDMVGGFNALALRLSRGANVAQVIVAVDNMLARYGGLGAISRRDQPSHQVLADELQQLRSMAALFPAFFLGIGAFILNVVLSRLIATQRGEIGTLKAFGYTNRAVGLHYLGFASAAIVLGAALGVGGGIWLGHTFTGLYDQYFGFPNLVHHTRWSTAVLGIAVSGGAALAGALWAVRSAAILPPAQAMRPASPARYRRTLVERLGLGSVASVGTRMVARTLERRPVRTGLSILGVALACGILIAGLFPYDAVGRMMDVQFQRARREDLAVAFRTRHAGRVRHELAALPGVTHVELSRTTPVRLRRAHVTRSVAIEGIDGDAQLRSLVDTYGRAYRLPREGIVIGKALAQALDARTGDHVTVELLERRITRTVVVTGVLDEAFGLAAYTDRRVLNRLLDESDVATAAAVSVERGSEGMVARMLRARPGVSGISSRAALIAYVQRSFADSIRISGGIVVFAAIVIAVGVIYNGARVALSERGRELASLRVLGFTRREVSVFFLGEQGAITAAGLPLGAGVGLVFAALLAKAFDSERHRFPVIVEPSTYLFAIGVVVLTAVAVAFLVRRRLDRLDLIATLKTGE
ncbi:MAG TPA: ABC transporter permease [Gemmatimonadaceae bacterium]|nr:ABC transporter permease [Gemmatimonadaceae bacterium]